MLIIDLKAGKIKHAFRRGWISSELEKVYQLFYKKKLFLNFSRGIQMNNPIIPTFIKLGKNKIYG